LPVLTFNPETAMSVGDIIKTTLALTLALFIYNKFVGPNL
jgi:hypothetical protein